jgi:hypothetical protein
MKLSYTPLIRESDADVVCTEFSLAEFLLGVKTSTMDPLGSLLSKEKYL